MNIARPQARLSGEAKRRLPQQTVMKGFLGRATFLEVCD
jgi:hypothetical protein